MVKAKLDTYYTFRVSQLEPVRYQSMKWEEFGSAPVATYDYDPMLPGNQACRCPAYTSECKHVKCIQEAVYDGKAKEFWKWRWDPKHGWQLIDDMRAIEDEEDEGL